MGPRATDIPDLGFQVGDHVCAFYSGGSPSLHDVVVDFVSRGLRAGDKCACIIDTPSSVLDRIPGELIPRNENLQFFTEEQGYLPEGHFSIDAFIRNMETMVKGVLSAGYDRFWLVGDTSVVVRKAVEMKTWFTAEAEMNEFAPRYPQFIMCLYDLELFDGEMVMYVLKTHPRIFVNGMIITNPYYIPGRQFSA